jgi:hypothetical protein
VLIFHFPRISGAPLTKKRSVHFVENNEITEYHKPGNQPSSDSPLHPILPFAFSLPVFFLFVNANHSQGGCSTHRKRAALRCTADTPACILHEHGHYDRRGTQKKEERPTDADIRYVVVSSHKTRDREGTPCVAGRVHIVHGIKSCATGHAPAEERTLASLFQSQ